jgi:hypothetical protein
MVVYVRTMMMMDEKRKRQWGTRRETHKKK